MHKLIIHNLGPVDDCELTCRQFMTFTGEQASGKSTAAKTLYYFRTVKDDLLSALQEKFSPSLLPMLDKKSHDTSLVKILRAALRKKFLDTFGYSVKELRQGMKIKYSYSEDCYITVRLIISRTRGTVILSAALSTSLTETIFHDNDFRLVLAILRDYIYIPSGRSMLALLTGYVRRKARIIQRS